jgi:hypothetical protein
VFLYANASKAVIALDGVPGQLASVYMESGAYFDLGRSAGAISNAITVSVPVAGLPVASTSLSYASAAAFGLSALSCAASVVIAPGWGSGIACGAAILRSLGHLQVRNALLLNMLKESEPAP